MCCVNGPGRSHNLDVHVTKLNVEMHRKNRLLGFLTQCSSERILRFFSLDFFSHGWVLATGEILITVNSPASVEAL